MDRSMLAALVALILVTGARAEQLNVFVVPSGQYYHRAEHLVVDEIKALDVHEAVASGYTACPDCTPPTLAEHGIRDDGTPAFISALEAERKQGAVYANAQIVGRVSTLKEQQSAPPIAPVVAAQPAPALGAPNNPIKLQIAPGAPPADTSTIPGTGGLLKAAQFAPDPLSQSMTSYGKPILQPAQ